ncbi:MAG: hypothetical protein A2176_15730 [Spirochaetes bacterium RBG_13_51_14]|nr:MAG: hypothetical protein A2176_15730 [Spirochaetes bacterium RBG_13_51_14]
MIAYVTESDILRWEAEQRHDMLSHVHDNRIAGAGDTIVFSSGKRLKTCLFLNWDGDRFFCEIYETQPQVCRDFEPGSTEFCPLCSAKKCIH